MFGWTVIPNPISKSEGTALFLAGRRFISFFLWRKSFCSSEAMLLRSSSWLLEPQLPLLSLLCMFMLLMQDASKEEEEENNDSWETSWQSCGCPLSANDGDDDGCSWFTSSCSKSTSSSILTSSSFASTVLALRELSSLEQVAFPRSSEWAAEASFSAAAARQQSVSPGLFARLTLEDVEVLEAARSVSDMAARSARAERGLLLVAVALVDIMSREETG
mmetsp:Transcript_12822/g.27190  ORF Transcript_12822/g.27190 Transcript_12822/m.27190 type:complete len:219 (+) Transcript_12822:2846-3502(+)